MGLPTLTDQQRTITQLYSFMDHFGLFWFIVLDCLCLTTEVGITTLQSENMSELLVCPLFLDFFLPPSGQKCVNGTLK